MRYVFDLDGTICTQKANYADAEPIDEVIGLIRKLKSDGHQIVIFTARGTQTGIDWRETTEGQLKRWDVPYDTLMFGKPAADVYIDDRAVNVVDFIQEGPND